MKRGGVDPRPYVALACAMIVTAIKDMRERRPRHIQGRIDAIVWLVGSGATPWFDASGVDHQYALDGMGWAEHAQHLLDGHGDELSSEQSRLLAGGIEHLRVGRRCALGGTGRS